MSQEPTPPVEPPSDDPLVFTDEEDFKPTSLEPAEPATRAALDFHPKFVAGGLGGAVGVIVSALALYFLDVEIDPEQAAIAVGVVVNLIAGAAAYMRSSQG